MVPTQPSEPSTRRTPPEPHPSTSRPAPRLSLLPYLLAQVLAFLVLLPGAMAQDTGSIAGRLLGHDREGVALATASLPKLALSVALAGDGTFVFDAVPPGTYILVVDVPSAGRTSESVIVTAGEETAVELELDHAIHFDEVVVTATGDLREQSELSNAVSVLGGADLQLRMGATLGETLASEPGVSSTAFVPGAARPVIRGLTGHRVRVLANGVDIGDLSATSADHAVTSDPIDADRIEVLRGPATLRYGSEAIGGVVNVIDGRVPTSRAATSLSGTIDLIGGSVADERMGALELSGGGGEWAWTIGAVNRETDPYEIPGFSRLEDDHEEDHHDEEDHGDEDHDDHDHDEEDHHDDHEDHHEEENPFGLVPNTDLRTESARFGVTRFLGDRGFIGAAVSGFNTDYGIPPGAHVHEGHEHGDEDHHDDDHDDHDDEDHEDDHDDHDDEDHEDDHDDHDDHHGAEEEPIRIDMKQQRVDLRSDVLLHSGAFEKLEVRMAGTDYEHVELEGDEVGTLYTNDHFETRVEMFQRGRGATRGSVGFQYSDRDLVVAGAEAFVPPTVSNTWALFTSQEIEKGAVRWHLGARFEQTEHDPDGSPTWSGDGVSASAGLFWIANDRWTVGLSAARSVRQPGSEELFSDGFHVATLTYDVGDPNLDAEVGTGLDLSLRKREGRLQGELTLFRQDFQDFIFAAFTGAQIDDVAVIRYHQEDAAMTGAELRARIEIAEWNENHFHVELLGDTVDADLDAGGNVPRIPPMSFGAGLHYHGHNWRGAAEWRWVDDQHDVAEQETPTDGYTMLNAHIGRRFVLKNQALDVLLRGRNLTDEEARMHTSYLKSFAPLPGRDITLSVRFWF